MGSEPPDQGRQRFLLPGPLLFWNSSVIGGSASSWMVGTDARRPDKIKHTGGLSTTPKWVNRRGAARAAGASLSAAWAKGASSCTLTEPSVVGQLLVDLLHPLDVESAALGVVDHGFGVIHPHHAVGCLLDRLRSVPRLVDVAVGVVLQDGDVVPWGDR